MESWNHIIHTALLGTEKKSLTREDVDVDIAEGFDAIARQAADKEEVFLQMAALVYNYRQCGFVPFKKETALLPIADKEERTYASPFAHVVLQDIVDTASASLLRFWLEHCIASQKIVHPKNIPLLLNTGVKNKEARHLVKTCCGKRGEWLAQFNAEWKWSEEIAEEELWQTGTLAQRSAVLAQMRTVDPAKARELLQQTWPQESAANKTELVEQLAVNAGDDDVIWLQEVLNEKSAKVKEAALQVLKIIPASSIVQSYWNILKQSVHIVTSKGILGIGAKTKLEINLIPIDENIVKTGVQKLSGEKGVSDEQFILYQLIALVPPLFWETHFSINKEEIIRVFSKDEEHKSLLPAFGSAAIRFKDVGWLRKIIAADEERMHLDAFALLPQKEAEEYAMRFLSDDNNAANLLHQVYTFSAEWSLPFAKALLRYTAKNPYQYHKAFYSEIIHLVPVSMVGELEKCTPKEEQLRTMWSNMSEYITKLLTLKLQTLKAFNE